MYVYLAPAETGDPYTVGFYKPDGIWEPESDHDNQEEAVKRVAWLNGNGGEINLNNEDPPNYYVTDHFKYSDFICPCCDVLKIVPGFYRHVSLLERMGQELDSPIIVTSGYRCKSHNAIVGGSPRSWHLIFATDIKFEDDDQNKLEAMYEIAVILGFGGIGRYETHLHLDLRPEEVRWRA